jgi:hypothetical protein
LTCFADAVWYLQPRVNLGAFAFRQRRPGHFAAVQVKCTLFEIAEGLDKGYLCTVCSSSRPYRRGSFDFLAAYLIEEDAWYIIPEEEILGKKSISLATNCEEARYEDYREAWHLLKECAEDENKGIDIQACVEEFSELDHSKVGGLQFRAALG